MAYLKSTNIDGDLTLTGSFDIGGQLNLNDNSLKYQGFSVPIVIESGTSNIWTYRKWSDGVLECWGNYEYSFNANTAHTAWGGSILYN